MTDCKGGLHGSTGSGRWSGFFLLECTYAVIACSARNRVRGLRSQRGDWSGSPWNMGFVHNYSGTVTRSDFRKVRRSCIICGNTTCLVNDELECWNAIPRGHASPEHSVQIMEQWNTDYGLDYTFINKYSPKWEQKRTAWVPVDVSQRRQSLEGQKFCYMGHVVHLFAQVKTARKAVHRSDLSQPRHPTGWRRCPFAVGVSIRLIPTSSQHSVIDQLFSVYIPCINDKGKLVTLVYYNYIGIGLTLHILTKHVIGDTIHCV